MKNIGNDLNKLVVEMYLALKKNCVMNDSTRSFLYASLKQIENLFREAYTEPTMPKLKQKQAETKAKVELFAKLFDIDPKWAVAVAMTESSLGLKQKSPTGCRGVFQMSTIAMKDLLIEMAKSDDDLADIACGVAFLHLLMNRWGNKKDATMHFCDPADRDFYWKRVQKYMKKL